MSKKRYILAVDQGTTGTHVAIVDERLRRVGHSYQEFRQYFPKAGWVEHDLSEIWNTVELCIAKALKSARLKGSDLMALGITNQRETVGLWRPTGKPLGRAIVWQDRRTTDLCRQLQQSGVEPAVRERTGLVLDPYFSGTKIRWLLEHSASRLSEGERGELRAGTIDSWLVFKMTGHREHVTEASNASRTLLMNLRSLAWDEEQLRMLQIPRGILPHIRGSAEVLGHTLNMRSLPDGIPISGAAGDQQAALFGQACFEPGEAKCTYGTGAFVLMNTGLSPVPSKAGLLSTVAWSLGGETTYALEGSSFIAGAAVQWLRDGLQIIRKSADIEKLARTVKDSGGVIFVPALAGLGAPHWRPEARGLLWGMDRGTTRGHVARAVLEGIALQVVDLVHAMAQDANQALVSLKVDGGASVNNDLMQYQADALGASVVRPKNTDTTAMGAAFLAGLGAGLFPNLQAVRDAWTAQRVFRPKWTPAQRTPVLERWKLAVQRA